ncbi:F510_1955 family glycosylhydrolase [Nonomuraea sp. NPDC050643]|uniref:F510_1955 family glycosylhydrolase n=1 Tax=Nonomuraea sp. NPDC050643 TaxID=3155660 RepID=UPI00340837EE
MRNTRLRATAAALAVLALVASACGPSPSSSAPGPDDPGIGHIHGLGVDPADGALYLAGHYGLFKVTSVETAQRVAGRIQDHMGFTVTGPGTFLASGHPGDPQAASPHLGLIRSSDAGRTWVTVSEGGAADFHSLQPAGDKLYAYDSQTRQVRASADGGTTWMPGTDEDAIDLAANAGEPDRLYATTQGGLRVSTDGGTSFAGVQGAPLLSHVDSPAKGLLVGPDTEGRLQTSRDEGRTWQAGGALPGQATAFAAVDGNRLLATTEDGTVYESRNGGGDFTVVFRSAAS